MGERITVFMSGKNVGEADGAADGRTVGLDVGSHVGAAVLGTSVGTSVGNADGLADGPKLPKSVGSSGYAKDRRTGPGTWRNAGSPRCA